MTGVAMETIVMLELLTFILLLWGNTAVVTDPSIAFYQHALGGDLADIRQYPFIVSLQKKVPLFSLFVEFTFVHRCSGTIISENWILTSGMCVWDFQDSMIIDLTEHIIVAGVSNCSIANDQARQYEMAEIILHPDYDIYYQINDVSLIRIIDVFVFSKVTYHIDLASVEALLSSKLVDIINKKDCITIGFRESNELLSMPRRIIPFADCSTVFPEKNFVYNFLCSYNNISNTCTDTGSPIVCDNVQVGIASQGCIAGGLSIWTKISRYYNWIMEKTNIRTTIKRRKNTASVAMLHWPTFFVIFVQ